MYHDFFSHFVFFPTPRCIANNHFCVRGQVKSFILGAEILKYFIQVAFLCYSRSIWCCLQVAFICYSRSMWCFSSLDSWRTELSMFNSKFVKYLIGLSDSQGLGVFDLTLPAKRQRDSFLVENKNIEKGCQEMRILVLTSFKRINSRIVKTLSGKKAFSFQKEGSCNCGLWENLHKESAIYNWRKQVNSNDNSPFLGILKNRFFATYVQHHICRLSNTVVTHLV